MRMGRLTALLALLVYGATPWAQEDAYDGLFDDEDEVEVIRLPDDERESSPGEARADSEPPPRAAHIEEIVVTVSKRAERVQDVSSAVSAFNGRMMNESNIQDFAKLADFTPGLVTRNEESLTIRGVGKARGGTSPVAFHVNGFILEGRGERFYDLAAVEVLRGPSGTVYGRNATAGAINAKWAPPELELMGGGDIRYGDYSARELRAFVNLPLMGEGNPVLAARAAAVRVKRRGYFNNLDSGFNPEPDSQDEGFERIYLTSEPTDNLRMAFRHIKNRSTPWAGVASAAKETRESGILEKFGAQTQSSNLLEVRSLQYRDFERPSVVFDRNDAELTWSFNELPLLGNIDLDILGGRFEGDAYTVTDLDGTEEPIVETLNTDLKTGRNVELRLTSQNTGGFNWLVGLFWYHHTNLNNLHVDARTERNPQTVFEVFAPEFAPITEPTEPGQPNRIFDADVDFINALREDRSKAAFFNFQAGLGQLFEGFPEIEIFGGLRLNEDALHLKTDREVIFITDYETGEPVPEPIDDKSTDIRGDFDATTGELGAKWFHGGSGLLEEGMLYGKYARGYKPGTVQLLAGEELNSVDPEVLNMFEAGWKSSFLYRALTLNLTAFHYDYTDLQVAKIIITGQKLENAGSAVIDGVELELQFTPSYDIYTQLSISLLNAKFNEFCGKDEEVVDQAIQPGCTEDEPHNFKGATLSDAPKISISGLLRYSIDLGGAGKLVPMISSSWQDDYQRRPYDNPIDHVDGHTKTDIRLAWESATANWRAETFVENLEDHDNIFADHFSMPDPGAYSLLSVAPSRTYGMRLEYKF